jgi:exoribonuclease R
VSTTRGLSTSATPTRVVSPSPEPAPTTRVVSTPEVRAADALTPTRGPGLDLTGPQTAPIAPRAPTPSVTLTPALGTAGDATLAVAALDARAAAPTADAPLFREASAAAAAIERTFDLELALRPAQPSRPNPRLPPEIPGVLRARGDVTTFYPADEAIAPFDVPSATAASLPKGVLLVARSTKRDTTIVGVDGQPLRAPLYGLDGSKPAPPRARFVGVVDRVDGTPYVRDLSPPPRLVALPATQPGGAPWVEGTVVEVSTRTDDGRTTATIERERAAAGTPLARTWALIGRERLDATFSARCVAEAEAARASLAASLADPALEDLTALPFFAIDNPGGRDIDQAMHLERRADGGFVLHYALADAAAYAPPGSALHDASLQRGATHYFPGASVSMMTDVIAEQVASLNAHETHRALLLSVPIGPSGEVDGPTGVRRAKVTSRAQLTYPGVSAHLAGERAITADDHGRPVPQEVLAQLSIFEALGEVRQAVARARGVVSPDRAERVVAFDSERFFLVSRKDDRASKLNAELSILANVAGARALIEPKIPGVWVPGIFRTHAEPEPSAYAALSRQIDVVVRRHRLPDTWRWSPTEPLAAWVERLQALPTDPRERALSSVLQGLSTRINEASSYAREPGVHSGLKVDPYGRFTAPMREVVGLVSHAVLFAKSALERGAEAAGLSAAEAQALWAPLLLGAVVPPGHIPAPRRALADAAQALLRAGPDTIGPLARQLADEALAEGPGLTEADRRAVDAIVDRAMGAGNESRQRQKQIDGGARKLLFDDLFMRDLGGLAMGTPDAPRRGGYVTSVAPGKVYVQLDEPDVEVRLGADDLARRAPGARFYLDAEGAALTTKRPDGKRSRVYVGDRVEVQATHHDGEKLHFALCSG